MPVLAVAGVGLIGGSFAAALRRAGAVGRVLGVGRRPETLARARELGLIDEAVSAAEAAARADLLLLSVPVGATGQMLEALAPHLRADAIVTDAGSTKQDVVAAARAALGARIGQFVPGHPIAGSERSGPDAAHATLYDRRTVILTPLPENQAAQVARVRDAWQACGALVRQMPADTHDTALGSVSHLPHLLAFAYMAQVAGAADAALRLDLAGSGFRDFTRIAGGSPDMWRDIFLANRRAVLDEAAQVRRTLEAFETAIREGDADILGALIRAASQARHRWEAGLRGAADSTDNQE
ncbi:prephenate dehydrogenase [Pigmentiphaga soli]|uniref:prephenate dehydrogenase n=1 Tax=Pigmentiphaga soli TaxID=1007095 RepID=UPI0031E599AB